MFLKFNINYLLTVITVTLGLIIYPWTKEIDKFRADDVTWDILSLTIKTEKFDVSSFSFLPNYKISEEIKKLDGQKIRINGFFKKEGHAGHLDYFLTETVTDVCFMCNHDEHYNFIKLIPETENKQLFDTLKNDKLIKVSGVFEINTKIKAHPIFLLKKVRLDKIIKQN